MEIKTFGSICSGTGFQEMAIKKVYPGIELKYFAEIDKHAINSFKAIHGDVKNLGDFTQIEKPDHVDFLFASTPCQDFSLIGGKQGFDGMKGSLTFEFVNYLKRMETLPQVIGFENVIGLLSDNFINGYNAFKNELGKLGYKVNEFFSLGYDSGIPQSRPRIFLLCTQGNYIINKPVKKELKFTLYDVWKDKSNLVKVPSKYIEHFANRKTNFQEKLKTRSSLIAKCLTTKSSYHSISNNFFTMDFKEYVNKECLNKEIYALNERGYWCLMGSEKEYVKAREVVSETQLYKIAGNGIIVDVLVDLFTELKNSKLIDEKFDLLRSGEIQYKLF